ncbi:MAG: hypothetical protein ACFFBP_03375 [Promethearchaeota archaeon]
MSKQVKGTMVKLMVKAARANKNGDYDNILTDDAKNLVSQRILDSIWYSYEAYRSIHDAVVKIDGRDNPKILNQWGQKFGEGIMTSIYKNTIVDSDIEKLLERYRRFHTLVYNWGEIKTEKISETQINITYERFERDWEFFYYIAIGWMQRFMELCIGKKVNFRILKQSWNGDTATTFTLYWNS